MFQGQIKYRLHGLREDDHQIFVNERRVPGNQTFFVCRTPSGGMSTEERDDRKFLAYQMGVTCAQLVFCPQIAWEGSAKLPAAT